MRKLTERQKEYARRRAKGATLKEAYKGAGYSDGQNDNTARRNAWVLENKSASADAIRARIEQLQARADAGAVLDRKARQGLLSDVALNESEETRDRLRAVDMLCRMSGDYSDNVTIQGTVSLSYADRLDAIADSIE